MSKYRRTYFHKRVTMGHGWVARWPDGTLGWLMPTHLGQGNNTPERQDWWPDQVDLVLCKITVEVVRRKDGRVIGRREDRAT